MALVRPIGLDHVVLRCADIEASLTFYVDVLGLEPERVEQWRQGDAPFAVTSSSTCLAWAPTSRRPAGSPADR